MTEALRLAAYVDDHINYSGDLMPFKIIMRQAVAMRTMTGSRMYCEHGQWFMEFTFTDGSNITYGIDDED